MAKEEVVKSGNHVTAPATPEAARRTRAPNRTKAPPTFADHLAGLLKTFEALSAEDRERALATLRALYPHHLM